MRDKEKKVLFEEAKSLANKILSGDLQPNDGCFQIGEINRALDWPSELAGFGLLAHLQSDHESIGATEANCVPEILAECRKLIEASG
jgi:hypothetical protein